MATGWQIAAVRCSRMAASVQPGERRLQQKVIGLIGGMSWESSAEYYRIINQRVRDRLGGLRSARCLMWSFDFGEIEALQHAGRWDEATALMIEAAQRLERGGADFVLICTNTMHRMADEVQAAVGIPLLHIADPTAERIKAAGLQPRRPARHRLHHGAGFLQGPAGRKVTGWTCWCPGMTTAPWSTASSTRSWCRDGSSRPRARPTGRSSRGWSSAAPKPSSSAAPRSCCWCRPEDSAVPLFDTTAIHAEAAVDAALGELQIAE